MARFADGLAVEPDLTAAAESAVGQALDGLSEPADLVCVFVCGDDPDAVTVAGERAMTLAGDAVTIGCSATGVIGGDRGIESTSSVSAWAASLPGTRITDFHLATLRTADRLVVAGLADRQADDVVGVLLVDPYNFPVDAFVKHSWEVLGGLPLIGGLADGSRGADSVRLFAGGKSYAEGAVGLLLGGAVTAKAVVSQGCRPIGPSMVVTKAEESLLLELAGVPALAKLQEIVAELTESERQMATGGLQIGIAMDEYAERHERGDFLIRGVIGIDPDLSAIAIGDIVEVGRTVRFQIRDASSAEEDLGEVLDGFVRRHGPAEGALLFCCNGRGSGMFDSADHDVLALRRRLGVEGVAGFFAAGEIGPVAGHNHVHGFTASILAFPSAQTAPLATSG